MVLALAFVRIDNGNRVSLHSGCEFDVCRLRRRNVIEDQLLAVFGRRFVSLMGSCISPLPIAFLAVQVPSRICCQFAWPFVQVAVIERATFARIAPSAMAQRSPSDRRVHGRLDRFPSMRRVFMPSTTLLLSNARCIGPGLAKAAMTPASSALVELLKTPGIAPAILSPGAGFPSPRVTTLQKSCSSSVTSSCARSGCQDPKVTCARHSPGCK